MTLENLVVVDIDPRNGGDVDALPQPLPDTCIARTGGGGLHYLYRSKNGTKYPGKLGPGIDVKKRAGILYLRRKFRPRQRRRLPVD